MHPSPDMQSTSIRPASAAAHPLVVPMPRLIGPVRHAARRLVLGALAADSPGRVDLILPDGARRALGAGAQPLATVRVHDDRAFARMLWRGELGAGEAYTAGDWDADDLPAALRWFLRATGARGVESAMTRLARLPSLWRHRRAANDRAGSARNIAAHYDLGNRFYQQFLDDELVYSCGVWTDATTLAEAQRAKLERLCALAGIGPGDRVLEIGCGWGALALHAARTRGCRVTAITVSPAQLEHAQARAQAEGLADRVRFELCDYRDVRGRFDAIVSCEMLEAVGYEFLPRYFGVVAERLRPGGRAAIQSITMPDERFEAYRRSVDWMQTYIFPGSLIPSLGAIKAALTGTGLALTAAHDIGPEYAPTLAAWRARFTAALPTVRALGFDDTFVRAWTLYLAFSEAAFAERTLADHQLVLTRT
ncbi:MAG: class I SAM-dependent methyltransferase [Myxococcales bacterium]|nr:class I SAM-dependent methyltransferase [Myxococcales bacterium]